MLDTWITEDDEKTILDIIRNMNGKDMRAYSTDIAEHCNFEILKVEAIIGKLAYDKKVHMTPRGWSHVK